MVRILIISFFLANTIHICAQDLSYGLNINDTGEYLMQPIAKPGYLNSITDPSFGTTIRRISDAGDGGNKFFGTLMIQIYFIIWKVVLMILLDIE